MIVTQDQDYATLLAASGGVQPSIVRLRMRNARAEAHSRALLRSLERMTPVLAAGAIVVLEEGQIRVRMLPIIRGA